MIKNKTELQQRIINSIVGYKIADVIHAFEVIKLDALYNDGKIE